MTLRVMMDAMDVAAVRGRADLEVTGLAYDSRRVRPGDVFFALPGLETDGRGFVPEAVAHGAVATVVRGGTDLALAPEITVVEVAEPRQALAQAAHRFYERPSQALRVVGVTGTNGKTTTTYLVHAIAAAAGWPAGLIGTTGVRLGNAWRPASFTTPEAPELQQLLREMVDLGMRCVALELSSHALVQRRCHGLEVDVAIFTNLSRDHLDYHGTLERYLDAKLMVFDGRNAPRATKPMIAVVNADDAAYAAVRDAVRRRGGPLKTFGASAGADLVIDRVTPDANGLTFELRDGAETLPVVLPLLGAYNAWNAAAAFAAARALGIARDVALQGLARAPGVPGRLERVVSPRPIAVVVDYAHTPDALERALAAIRDHFTGRVLLVFGCGGDRDRGKRPLMGKVAAERADQAWVTNDNPRSESPAAIADEIVSGAAERRLGVELDRRAAIAAALAAARPGDVVLIAGKGHETTQTIGGQVLPFDDRQVAGELLHGATP